MFILYAGDKVSMPDIMFGLTRLWQLGFTFTLKNVINRYYRSELKNRCSFVACCLLTAGERFDNISCNIRFVIDRV